jgi:hypothetical protein
MYLRLEEEKKCILKAHCLKIRKRVFLEEEKGGRRVYIHEYSHVQSHVTSDYILPHYNILFIIVIGIKENAIA